MISRWQRVELNDGHFMPVLGFGTYAPNEVTTVRLALGLGRSDVGCVGTDLGCQVPLFLSDCGGLK